jgi:Cdc37 Hsp90 binding domain
VVDSTDLLERSILAQPSQLSALARRFVDLGLGNYIGSSRFIADNPSILAKSEIDALIAEASVAQRAGQLNRAQTCIHQALLLRQCKEVGSRQIGSFFQDLIAKDGRAKDSFVKDVKKVYISIQQQAGKTSDPRHGPSPGSERREPPVVLQPIEQTISDNSYAPTQDSDESPQSQTPVARGQDGKLYYTDAQGNLLHPASRRHDPERHRSQSDPIEPSGELPAVSTETSSLNGAYAMRNRRDDRHRTSRTGSFHRPTPSGPPAPLPTVPEHRKYESTKIKGTAGSVEKLDEREYSLIHRTPY